MKREYSKKVRQCDSHHCPGRCRDQPSVPEVAEMPCHRFLRPGPNWRENRLHAEAKRQHVPINLCPASGTRGSSPASRFKSSPRRTDKIRLSTQGSSWRWSMESFSPCDEITTLMGLRCRMACGSYPPGNATHSVFADVRNLFTKIIELI